MAGRLLSAVVALENTADTLSPGPHSRRHLGVLASYDQWRPPWFAYRIGSGCTRPFRPDGAFSDVSRTADPPQGIRGRRRHFAMYFDQRGKGRRGI